MEINKQTPIGEIVSKDFRTAGIFERYGIDYCCGGKEQLGKACSERGIDIENIVSELNQLNESGEVNTIKVPDKNWRTDELINHIVSQHHRYVKGAIPEITQRLQKTADTHGKNYPYLKNALELFGQLGQEMTFHMMKEEKVLFPFIHAMVKANSTDPDKRAPLMAPFNSVQIPIEAMEREHVAAGNLTDEIRQVCSDFNPPEDACITFKAAYAGLKEFEHDLHVHIHVENNILFPKAITLEKKLRA
jgi:regulator of cell morphogenesis and NO signaling